ncbi:MULTISPECIES: translational GTPase TypA [unclassified Apibacter]|uniref:translational GTPase TypA n=1 Tax=unclassified Apibacter TaxID=2630820 RepID=UPI0013285686|nr:MULTISPECIES: translational GTPase TypA [unclassified Apibacter]MCX8677109.1 translational GTPase TypA [Apibacter sp. B3919]MXO24511.1 translational GTPase TypA [Apibacter sp. B3924]MXO25755.1 translational GTPase TypA [Apibacter sp. B3813]MXO27706.1 translational GTPase TypA [Apibacter sp. B3913]MXO29934.1 translational GTPase TypA [Apibacter sp. B3912]
MQSIRNIAIIAHVDHGKTTLVDKIIQSCNVVEKNDGDLILDNNDLERERGITILSKNVSVNYKGVKINIIDTPGHADFGGEVERVLKMADGVLLLVDAFEGPMPQTRFVLSKAIELGLKPIVVINKVDKENCQPEHVHDQVFELMFNLDATEEQLDFETVYGSSKQGWMSGDYKQPTDNITYLLDKIIELIPEAPYVEGTPQMQITSLDFSSFVGKIAIGRVYRGDLISGKDYTLCQEDGKNKKIRIKELQVFEGLGRKPVESVRSGDLCAVIGIDDFEIGDTIADLNEPEALPRIAVDEPTMSMLFTINTSPFFGKEGKYVTSRHLRDRLMKETEINLALRVEETDSEEKFNVFGRGILHLSVLIETMRREGYELQVGRPKVTIKEIDGVKHEPYEHLVIDVPDAVSGKAIELVTQRKGELKVMEPKGDLQHLEFDISSRGLIGLRNLLLTATSGEAIINHRFKDFEPVKDIIPQRQNGSMISSETGQALAYAIDRLQDRGKFFVEPGDQIYKGQVVGEHSRDNDLEVNLIKGKKLTNVRASGSDQAAKIFPKVEFSLEEAMEYIKDDEYLEITPKSLRMRKI